MDIILYTGVIYKGNLKIGTGFVIDPENRLLVTALHVLDDFRETSSSSVDDFFFKFFNSETKYKLNSQIATSPREKEDIALLELADKIDKELKPPTLISYVTPTSDIWTVGYVGHKNAKGEYKPAQGKISGYAVKNGAKIYELDIDGIYKGMSGAPIMIRDVGVIGILTTRISENDNSTAWVTPVDVIASLDGRIKTPRKTYLQNLITSVSKKDGLLDVDEYVPVRVSVTLPDEEAEPLAYENIFEVTEKHKKFNLIGDAGSGKTTTLRSVAVNMAQNALNDQNASIPVWINLSDWRGERESFTEFIEKLLSTPSNRSIKNYYPLDTLVEENKITFFLDEFDEVKGKSVSELNAWVSDTNLSAYVGCRDIYFSGNWKIRIPTVQIESLNTIEAYQFAEKYFKSSVLADEFISIIAPDGYLDFKTSSHVSQLASNPLFLILMLADFKKNKWKSSNEGIRIPSIWSLFENILHRLWDSARVSDALQEKFNLAIEYKDKSIILNKLSAVAFKYSGQVSIPRSEIDNIFPIDIVAILIDTKIIKLNPVTDSYRLLHSLFADFLVANRVKTEDINEYAKINNWLSPLFILSTRDEATRKTIQDSLLEIISNDMQGGALFSFDKQKRVLGDIGDKYAIDVLLALFEKHPKRTDLLKPLAKIADRLPDQDDRKRKVIDTLKRIMFSPVWMNSDLGQEILSGLDWLMGDYVAATEAMASIKNPEALDAILTVLNKAARYYDNELASGAFFRQQWYSDYLSSMGKWVIPQLLDAIDSDHPDVTTTIANALLKINRPLDISKIGKVMLSHPVPMVRANLATTLGKIKSPDAIDFLEKALDDTQIWSRGTIAVSWRHYFVSDEAAVSLAQIGTPNASAILERHKYKPNGLPSTELLVERLESGFDINHRDPLRTQIAYSLARKGRLDLLLPRMGNIDLYMLDGYISSCPVAAALIRQYEDSLHSDDDLFLQDRVLDYVDPTDKILAFLDESQNQKSKSWALIVLGHIGSCNFEPIIQNDLKDLMDQPIIQDAKILPILRKHLLDYENPILQDAAAYGLGRFIERVDIAPQQAKELTLQLLNLLDSISPRNYTGVGMGLAKIVSTCEKKGAAYSEITGSIRNTLLLKVNSESLSASKTALDALETISIVCPNFIDNAVKAVIEFSPAYFFKLGNKEYLETRNASAFPGTKGYIDYDEALENYQSAIRESNLSQAPWKQAYKKTDWEELGLRSDRLFHQLGKVYVFQENWTAAFAAFKHSFEATPLQQITTPDKLFFAIYACSEIGNLLARFLNKKNESLYYFEMAMSLGRQASKTELTESNLSSVFCNAILNYQNIFLEKKDFLKVIEIGIESDHLLHDISHLPDDDLATIYLNTSTSLIFSRNMNEANHYALLAQARLTRSSDRMLKIGSLLRIAELQNVLGEQKSAEETIIEAITSAKRYNDEPLEARSQIALAHILDKNREPYRTLTAYQRALFLLRDIEHEKVLEEKAGVYHEMAVIYQDQGMNEEAEASFKTAIELVKKVTPDFPNMPYVIQAEYARFLHMTGRHDEAIKLLVQQAEELMSRGMDPSVIAEMLTEIDTPQGGNIPETAAKQWAEALIYVSLGRIDGNDYIEKMSGVLQHCVTNGWENEVLYIQSLLDLLTKQNHQIITESNPYYEYYQWAKDNYK